MQEEDIKEEDQVYYPDVVIVTGMSGAGRTEALHCLEDLGYYCIDNLPPSMIVPLTVLVGLPLEANKRLAVVCDVRTEGFFTRLKDELECLTEREIAYEVLFLDANDEALRKRYSSLRRRHPLAEEGITVSQAIALERERLGSIKEIANIVIDTSDLRAQELRSRIISQFSEKPIRQGINVSVCSFGFKYGIPLDADLVIDVRFLPNPFYDPHMRDLTGFDDPVRDYVMSSNETKKFLEAWYNLLDVVMPGYVNEGKQHLSIAVGCTGGQHRSVTIAEQTGKRLIDQGYNVSISHRDISKHVHGQRS
ncbi:MAG: RNase adapter RapZ [Coriobacteriales bacterium]|nr:RNase adapter RapZ [Coriobacteriales bacterium]